jgi:ATP-dependent DNA helicase RecG
MSPQDRLDKLFRLNPLQKTALKKLGLNTVYDLLRYFPARYEEPGEVKNIRELKTGEEAVIYGQVISAKTLKGFRTKIPMAEALIDDGSGTIKAIWFHQAYMAKKIPEGRFGEFRGKITERKGEIYLANPDVRETPGPLIAKNSLFSSGEQAGLYLVPVYPETRGLTSGWFYYHNQTILKENLADQLADPLPADLLNKYHLPGLSTALYFIHSPKKRSDAEAARKRFSFEEIFYIQLKRQQDKAAYQSNPSFSIKTDKKAIKEFLSRFPFAPTGAQIRAIDQIVEDFSAGKPMTRLLEGDVGSGKTAVAATTAFAAVRAGYEVAYMAPTEILARQHFESFIQYFKHIPNIQIGLLTGAGCRKFPSKLDPSGHTDISRPRLLKWVAEGQIPILVGTHALIQKTVQFKNLAYSIIDEQHRFGVMQRSKMVRKESDKARVPHLLSMTATPIPRTLALTIYGDLDLTLLDELPKGRKEVITEIVSPDKRQATYDFIRSEINKGRQAYVICPRIDEPDPDKEMALNAKSAVAEQARLGEQVFPEFMVGLVHGKMKPADKEEMMAEFTAGKIDILVATSVIEVGVNVPNATLIIIEGAERFGLAQLHQLRGRVFRSSHQAYCYLFTETKSGKSMDRLKALKHAANGFELAEHDLALRGAGGLSAGKQWGISDLGMEAIKNMKMVEAARTEAHAMLAADPALNKNPLIRARVENKQTEIHFE